KITAVRTDFSMELYSAISLPRSFNFESSLQFVCKEVIQDNLHSRREHRALKFLRSRGSADFQPRRTSSTVSQQPTGETGHNVRKLRALFWRQLRTTLLFHTPRLARAGARDRRLLL